MADDQLGEIVQPRTLAESLILTVLHRLGKMERADAETRVQLVSLVDSQHAADRSRARIHERLDEIAPKVAATAATVEAQGERLDALQPIVGMLKEAHIERRTIGKVLAAVCKNGWARAGISAAAGGFLLHQWAVVRDWLASWFK